MPDSDPAEGLYSLFLMGLTWLREDNPEVLARRGSNIFASFERASPVFKSARRLTEMSWDLMELVCTRSEVHQGEKAPGKRELLRSIAESEMHSIVLAVPNGELTPERLFGAGGYKHVITDAGITYAMHAAAPYAEIVNSDIFLKGWARYKAHMTALNTKHPRTSAQQAGTAAESADIEKGEEHMYIRPATRSEKDFDW